MQKTRKARTMAITDADDADVIKWRHLVVGAVILHYLQRIVKAEMTDIKKRANYALSIFIYFQTHPDLMNDDVVRFISRHLRSPLTLSISFTHHRHANLRKEPTAVFTEARCSASRKGLRPSL